MFYRDDVDPSLNPLHWFERRKVYNFLKGINQILGETSYTFHSFVIFVRWPEVWRQPDVRPDDRPDVRPVRSYVTSEICPRLVTKSSGLPGYSWQEAQVFCVIVLYLSLSGVHQHIARGLYTYMTSYLDQPYQLNQLIIMFYKSTSY
jgi:hypothetical protein